MPRCLDAGRHPKRGRPRDAANIFDRETIVRHLFIPSPFSLVISIFLLFPPFSRASLRFRLAPADRGRENAGRNLPRVVHARAERERKEKGERASARRSAPLRREVQIPGTERHPAEDAVEVPRRRVLVSSCARHLRVGINIKRHRARLHDGPGAVVIGQQRGDDVSLGREGCVRESRERRTERRRDGRSISTEKRSGKSPPAGARGPRETRRCCVRDLAGPRPLVERSDVRRSHSRGARAHACVSRTGGTVRRDFRRTSSESSSDVSPSRG